MIILLMRLGFIFINEDSFEYDEGIRSLCKRMRRRIGGNIQRIRWVIFLDDIASMTKIG